MGDVFSTGSGSTFAYGILDTYYKKDLKIDQAVFMAKRAISEATYQDSGSGGYCNVYVIGEDGEWKHTEKFVDNSEMLWSHRKGLGVDFKKNLYY